MSLKISSEENEEWRYTYNKNYMVSSLGRVWNDKRKRFINYHQDKGCLCKICNSDGTIDRWRVSHLVFYTFRGIKPRALCYRDNDYHNPALSNLYRHQGFKANFLPEEWEVIREKRRQRAEEKRKKKLKEQKGADHADTFRGEERFIWKRKT